MIEWYLIGFLITFIMDYFWYVRPGSQEPDVGHAFMTALLWPLLLVIALIYGVLEWMSKR